MLKETLIRMARQNKRILPDGVTLMLYCVHAMLWCAHMYLLTDYTYRWCMHLLFASSTSQHSLSKTLCKTLSKTLPATLSNGEGQPVLRMSYVPAILDSSQICCKPALPDAVLMLAH